MNTNTVTVWHANEPPWRSETPPRWDPANYTMVAIIAPDANGEPVSLDRAYFLTNHLDRSWWENAGVTRVGPECRSTSVGDVIYRDGIAYQVASLGFDRIEKKVA
jgi:hypothetical protein